MNSRTHKIILAAIAAFGITATSCVVPEGGYVAGGAGYSSGPTRTYSNYTITLADGYAGRGYYYGPPNVRYYDRQPGIVYYRTRESVPQHYWSHSRHDSHRDGRDDWDRDDRHDYDRDGRSRTTTTSTTTYTLREGDGYAGRGYYYGPPNVRYYERQPGVTYYRDINEVPRQYRTQTTVRTGLGLGF